MHRSFTEGMPDGQYFSRNDPEIKFRPRSTDQISNTSAPARLYYNDSNMYDEMLNRTNNSASTDALGNPLTCTQDRPPVRQQQRVAVDLKDLNQERGVLYSLHQPHCVAERGTMRWHPRQHTVQLVLEMMKCLMMFVIMSTWMKYSMIPMIIL